MNTLLRPDKNPAAMSPYIDSIVTAYQEAFAGEPWYERAKCPDVTQRCESGYTAVPVGETCKTCRCQPVEIAYPADELRQRFEETAATRHTVWYLELAADEVALAALAWVAKPSKIIAEKYNDNLRMKSWLKTQIDDRPVVWLDEVFANKNVRPRNNLANFDSMVGCIQSELGISTVAYRTITPQMVYAGIRIGGTIFGRNGDRPPELGANSGTVPDWRDLIVVNGQGVSS